MGIEPASMTAVFCEAATDRKAETWAKHLAPFDRLEFAISDAASGIAKAVSDYYGVQMDQLRGQKRDKAIVMPRQVAMFLMREETDVSLLRIGAELGGRDHSTVLHACDKITREVATNDELRREIAAVRELIYAD